MALPRITVGCRPLSRLASARRCAGSDGNRVEHPGPAQFDGESRRRHHGLDPVGREDAEIEAEGVGQGDEILGLRLVLGHDDPCPGGQQKVGGEVGGDEIGDRVHQRPALAQQPQGSPGAGIRCLDMLLRHHARVPSVPPPAARPACRSWGRQDRRRESTFPDSSIRVKPRSAASMFERQRIREYLPTTALVG